MCFSSCVLRSCGLFTCVAALLAPSLLSCRVKADGLLRTFQFCFASMNNGVMTNVDILRSLSLFVGDKQFLFFAPVSRGWRNAWGQRPTVTSCVSRDSSVSQLQYSFDCGLPRTRAGACPQRRANTTQPGGPMAGTRACYWATATLAGLCISHDCTHRGAPQPAALGRG